MLFPIAIEIPDGHDGDFGVTVPDLPGCFSAGKDLDDALLSAKEAIELHLEGISEDGEEVPTPHSLKDLQADPEYAGVAWAIVDIDVTRYMGKAEKINVTLPGNLIRRIDEQVSKTPGESRSGFLAKAAVRRLHEEPA